MYKLTRLCNMQPVNRCTNAKKSYFSSLNQQSSYCFMSKYNNALGGYRNNGMVVYSMNMFLSAK